MKTLKVFRDARLELDEYLGIKENMMRKLDISEIQDNTQLKDIDRALRQMKKIERHMNIWLSLIHI